MSRGARALLERASLFWLASMVVVSLGASFLAADSGLGWFAHAQRTFLVTSAGIVGIGLAVGVPLGSVAASGPRAADGALVALVDLTSVLPAVLVLAVAATATPGLFGLVCAAGLLRAVGFAWALRSELSRAAEEERDIVARNLGYGPLLVFFRERLPDAMRPVLSSAGVTGAWAVAIDAVVTRAGLGPLTPQASFGAALGRGEHPLLATLAVALGTGALYVLARSASDRLSRLSESEPFALVRK